MQNKDSKIRTTITKNIINSNQKLYTRKPPKNRRFSSFSPFQALSYLCTPTNLKERNLHPSRQPSPSCRYFIDKMNPRAFARGLYQFWLSLNTRSASSLQYESEKAGSEAIISFSPASSSVYSERR